MPEAVIDQFDENLTINFRVPVKGRNFKELARLIQVLVLVPDKEYLNEINKIEEFLRENLEKPKFTLKQKLVIIDKN